MRAFYATCFILSIVFLNIFSKFIVLLGILSFEKELERSGSSHALLYMDSFCEWHGREPTSRQCWACGIQRVMVCPNRKSWKS